MRRTGVLATMLAAIVGCSSGGNGVSDPQPGETSMATVTFRAGWPTAAGKSLVDWSETSGIYIEVWDDFGGYSDYCELLPEEPECTLELPVGRYYFAAERYDASYNTAEMAGTAGRLIPGQNVVVISFLNGDWTLDDPIVFSDGTELLGFRLSYDMEGGGFGPEAFEPNLPTAGNPYMVAYEFGTGYGSAQLRHYTQFGGGALNRSALDGGGYSLTNDCGESDGPDTYEGMCPGDGGPGSGDLWIRMLGSADGERCGFDCSEGDRAVSRLLPSQTFDPDISAVANATVVNGSAISGTFIEYEFDSYSGEIVEVTEPYVPPAPSGAAVVPGAPFAISVNEYRMVIVCRDGFNGQEPDTAIDEGNWNFSDCGSGSDGQGGTYYECGWLNAGGYSGECSLGLEPLDENLGEWCDGYWDGFSCVADGFSGVDDGVALPNEFVDMNGDGQIDTGSFFVSRFLAESFDVSGTSYPFTATGVPHVNETTITFQ